MKSGLYLRIIQDINEHRYSIEEIQAKLYQNDIEDLMNYLLSTFEESLQEFLEIDDFISIYHSLLFNITDAVDDVESLRYISLIITSHINRVRLELKPYNKKEKEKDDYQSKLFRLKTELSSNLSYCDTKMLNMFEYDSVKVLQYIIFELKDIEALKHVIETHKEVVNIYTNDDEPLIEVIIRFFIDNIDTLTVEDIDYYKRVITMILIRDELKIDYKQVDDIKVDLDHKIEKIQEENQRHIKYIKYLLNKHFLYNSVDSNIYNEVIQPKDLLDGRIDLRHLPTITIDYVKYTTGLKMLFDDAFSIQEKEDGTVYLYMHTPDVDEYIPRDRGLDTYMRNNTESIYVKNHKIPMIPYQIAQNISLIENTERPCISYRIHVSQDGRILGINFFKSLVRIDDNLSKNQADLLIKDKNYQFHDLLNSMHRICKVLREKRHDKDRRGPGGVILDEYNIWANIAAATFAEENGIIFPYKNLIRRPDSMDSFMLALKAFGKDIDEDAKDLLYSIEGAKERQFYSTINYGNARFNGMPYSNVGNPLREYISLDTCRLIKDLIIDEVNNTDYWEEKISNDCCELSESSSKVKELYKTSH